MTMNIEQSAEAEEHMAKGATQRGKGRAADPPTWSVNTLLGACERKHIWYEESEAFTTLRAVVVTCGETSVINVKRSLSEPEKIAAVAHELAHIALGHTRGSPVQFLRETRELPVQVVEDDEREREASIWAAHLLVRPGAFQAALHAARATGCEEEQALSRAIASTAAQLNVPQDIVTLWLQHRDWTFATDPYTWLTR